MNEVCPPSVPEIDVKQERRYDNQICQWMSRIRRKLPKIDPAAPVQLYAATFAVNLALLVGKSIAVALTGSLAITSTLLDSAVDVISSILLWCSNRAVQRTCSYLYPKGRRNLEQVAILVLATIMTLAAAYVIWMSAMNIVSLASHGLSFNVSNKTASSDCNVSELLSHGGPVFELPAIIICSLSVVLKIVLYVLCRSISKPSIQVMALDHRNDVISGIAALACGIIGDKVLAYVDPVGAALMSIFIICTWVSTAFDQIRLLTGYRATNEFINKLVSLIIHHDQNIVYINELTAVHHGINYIVGIDMAVTNSLTFRESRDIRRTLQHKLSRLDDVDRVYINVDFDTRNETTHF